MNDYSQHGEGKILEHIIKTIGEANKYVVEFGASDGYWLSNVRGFLDEGWTGLQMEGGPKAGKNGVVQEFITKENINSLFDKYNVPEIIDILSIDIDGNDYWVWDEIKREANVVVIEYNPNFDKEVTLALEYKPDNTFDGSYAYSASFKAMCNLAEKKGYYLYCETGWCNLFFIKNKFKELLPSIFDLDSLEIPFPAHGRDIGSRIFVNV